MTTFKRHNGTDWEYVGLPNNVGLSPQTIGYAQVVANQTGISAETDLTGLAVTVVVPEGRRIRISGMIQVQSATTAGTVLLRTKEGASVLQISQENYQTIGGNGKAIHTDVVVTPAAGSHTYKFSLQGTAGTLDMTQGASNPGFILVEDITGSTIPYNPSSVPVGQLAYGSRFGNQTGITTTPVLIGGLSVNVAVPAGRQIKVTGFLPTFTKTSGAPTWVRAYIRRNGVDIQRTIESNTNDTFTALTTEVIDSPPAGAHLYEIYVDTDTGVVALDLGSIGAAAHAFISVVDVTPTPAAGTGAPGSTLGYAERISNVNITTSDVLIPDLETTVTVPAGRRLRITGFWPLTTSISVDTTVSSRLWQNGLAGTLLEQQDHFGRTTFNSAGMHISRVVTPTAGTHTFQVSAFVGGAATAILFATATRPAWILVEDITGAVWPTGSSVTAGLFASEAWTPYVPTFTNLTVGSGVLEAAYSKLGRTVHYRIKWVFGAGSSVGSNPTYTLPVLPNATYSSNYPMASVVNFLDAGTTVYSGTTEYSSGLVVNLLAQGSGGTVVDRTPITASVPMVWTTNDIIFITGTYEAAS